MGGFNDFTYNDSMTAVTINDGVTEIPRSAFLNCEYLEEVIFPDSLRSIGDWAFYGCRSIRSISLPEGLVSIGEGAFRGCVGLQEAELPDSLVNMGTSAFDECSSLLRITLPESIEHIKESTFRECSSLTEIVFGGSERTIDNKAFWNCSAVETLVLPPALEKIGSDAFYYCSSLDRIHIPETVAAIGRCAFYGCSSLSDISFPDRGIQIGRSAFSKTKWWNDHPDGFVFAGRSLYEFKGSMPALTAVPIPDGTEIICEQAFSRRAWIKSVLIPESTLFIGESAFEECTELESVSLPQHIAHIGAKAFRSCTKLSGFVFPPNVIHIGDEAFRECTRLTDPILPSRLGTIGVDVFFGCRNVKQFSISESASYFEVRNGVLFSKDRKELVLYPVGRPDANYTVPEGTERIRVSAFFGSMHLKMLFLPGTLEKLEPDTFSNSTIEYIRVPRSIMRLPVGVFNNRTHIGFFHPELADKTALPVYLGGSIYDIPPERRNDALNGFLYALSHKEPTIDPWKRSYIDYLRENEETYAGLAVSNDSLLHLMIEEKILTERSTAAVLEILVSKDRADIMAELLSYQNEAFPARSAEDFSLDADDPEQERLENTAALRSRLLERSGIEGLRFAAAGRMKKFGFYSPNGTSDFSDLRNFIRKRGGTFAAAVTKDTDALILGDPSGIKDKIMEASRLGIPILTEDEFLTIVRRN